MEGGLGTLAPEAAVEAEVLLLLAPEVGFAGAIVLISRPMAS